MTNEAARSLVAGLCLLQLAAGASALLGPRRFFGGLAVWAALLCPVGILMISIARVGVANHWAGLQSAELGFLAGNLASAVAAIGLIRSSVRPVWAVAGLWLLNSLFCAFMVYLAFFFRLF